MRELRILVLMLEITVDNDDENGEVNGEGSGKVGERASAIDTLISINCIP